MGGRLVIAPHGDDETIGCGGTIAKYVYQNVPHFIGVLTSDSDKESQAQREQETCAALDKLGVFNFEYANLQHHPIQCDNTSVAIIEKWLNLFQPDCVLIPDPNEDDLDHAIVYKILKHAMVHCGIFPRIIGYEVWTPLSKYHIIEDITTTIDTKIAAIKHYQSQICLRRYDIASFSLARYRGIMTGCGNYAEVFSILT
jgi:LmbE family N-acetylglucosaminyl deacetylase